MVDIFMNERNVLIKYIDFYESLFSENLLTIQVPNISEMKKENSAEISLNKAFISCTFLTHYG